MMTARQRAGLPKQVLCKLEELARGTPGLELLVLFGSRGRGDAHAGSDWDFAFRGARSLDMACLAADLAAALSSDHVDLVDLDLAGGLLRYRIARDGAPIYESHPRVFEQFWLDSVGFWCDARHVLEPSYEAILQRTDG